MLTTFCLVKLFKLKVSVAVVFSKILVMLSIVMSLT